MKEERTKSSIYNAVAMITYTGILSLLSLITTNLILKNYGSDFNGVVATAGQIVNLLLIVEGGFSLAINVSLFKPYIDNDISKINSIMTAAKRTFFKIGLLFVSLGLVLSLIYSLIIKSDLNFMVIFLIIFMVILGTAFNLMFITKCQTMFQVSQKEYYYTIAGIITGILSSLSVIALILAKTDMVLIRLSILIFTIINGIVILTLYKRKFGYINLNSTPDYNSIKGTKDIMIQKLTSVIYVSSPMLFISTIISTKMASVYAVYLSIYSIIKMFIASLVQAPINGFGQLLSKLDTKEVYSKYKFYEYIIILTITCLISSALVVIIPFISLYTRSVTDINYVQLSIAIMLATIVFLEVIHLPAGNIINISGRFKVARKIQTAVCIVLVISLIIGGYFFGIYGILGGTILTNVLLAFLEINYVHKKIFNSNIREFLLKLICNITIIFLMVLCGNIILPEINSYLSFLAIGFITLIINLVIIALFNWIIFRKQFNEVLKFGLDIKNKVSFLNKKKSS